MVSSKYVTIVENVKRIVNRKTSLGKPHAREKPIAPPSSSI